MTTPRKSAKAAPAKPAEPAPPVADPLADLRQDGGTVRYPEPDTPSGALPDGAEGPAVPPADETDALRTIISEAVGRASTCWVGGTGDAVFDSEAAKAVVDDLVTALQPTVITEPEDDVDAVVARWHADTTADGFLHRGGRCGCAYIARMALGR